MSHSVETRYHEVIVFMLTTMCHAQDVENIFDVFQEQSLYKSPANFFYTMQSANHRHVYSAKFQSI